MTNLFETNITYLKEHQPSVYREVKEHLDSARIDAQYELMTDPVVNIQCNYKGETFLLHSKYDPQYECERWLDAYQIESNTPSDFVIYGLGLTYHLAPIIEKYPKVKLFIYEPEVGIFCEALKVIDAEQLFTHKNIVNISVGKSQTSIGEYVYYLYHYARFPIRVLDIPVYRTINTEHNVAFLKLLEKVTVREQFKKGFRGLFGDQMYRNSLHNISKMCKTPSLDILKEKFVGSTAIVVGGGPSLQYDIEYLRRLSQECLIIAAGSSVQSLMHYDITPHLLVSMDPGIHNAKIFTKNNLNEIPLLYMPQIHYQIIETHQQYNVFGYYNNDVIIDMYINVEEKDYTFLPTYSVTGTAIQAAAYLGAANVIFAGQDLSYPGKQMYSPGASHLSTNSNSKSDAALTEEVDNVLGGKNPTTFSMKKTLEDIEVIVGMFTDINFVNTSSKGAVIKGAEYMSIQEASKRFAGEKYNFNHIKSIIANTNVNFHSDFTGVREKTIEIVTALIGFRKVCGNVERELDKLLALSKTDFNRAETVLRSIEKKWKTVVSHFVFKDIIEEWMMLELNEYDKKILDVSNETDIVEKAKLLKDTLGTFCASMKKKTKEMQAEFETILQQVNS